MNDPKSYYGPTRGDREFVRLVQEFLARLAAENPRRVVKMKAPAGANPPALEGQQDKAA